ncbi:TetR/AcrR family transcriptional regulator [Leucobacter sp. CSA1]|uniref:TetR/AcrR family transcriptional regulator n=1 Tax=Leucobacter chromiisoli TaxID=2796471 RepID=A0A934Q860_9MICO|nr:TetR/AcrR family transcriptional regulator [Leucobacter chromiisoli]MBK0420014.1 TetR/AcrR family transcriptional regulator [Leucobacter chromiisoli]
MPKIVDHDERRRHIAEAATAVIMRCGFAGLTMREVAAEAGYAHGAIARYFPNKQSLLTAAFLQLTVAANDRIAAGIEDLRGLAALHRMCSEILPYGSVGTASTRVLLAFWDHASEDPGIREINRKNTLRWRGLMHRFLAEAREDGELDPELDVDAAVDRVSVHNAGWQVTAALTPDIAASERIDASLRALLDGFRRRG